MHQRNTTLICNHPPEIDGSFKGLYPLRIFYYEWIYPHTHKHDPAYIYDLPKSQKRNQSHTTRERDVLIFIQNSKKQVFCVYSSDFCESERKKWMKLFYSKIVHRTINWIELNWITNQREWSIRPVIRVSRVYSEWNARGVRRSECVLICRWFFKFSLNERSSLWK